MSKAMIEIRLGELTTPEKIKLFICEVEKKLLELPQMEHLTAFYRAHKVFGQEMFVPEGILVGGIHKFENLNVLTSGCMTVISPDGIKQRMKPGDIFIGSAETQRLFIAHEPSSWLTVLGTEETDPVKVREEFIWTSFEEMEDACHSSSPEQR